MKRFAFLVVVAALAAPARAQVGEGEFDRRDHWTITAVDRRVTVGADSRISAILTTVEPGDYRLQVESDLGSALQIPSLLPFWMSADNEITGVGLATFRGEFTVPEFRRGVWDLQLYRSGADEQTRFTLIGPSVNLLVDMSTPGAAAQNANYKQFDATVAWLWPGAYSFALDVAGTRPDSTASALARLYVLEAPEPSTWQLLCLGIFSLAVWRRIHRLRLKLAGSKLAGSPLAREQ